ncbi:cyclase family protein [Alkalibacter mobilis]|uniref:cyclase family protein n=1 Tax=Alkalibacter mobilis TaxID=2787712 RepID=UPI00189DB5E8|nr:cyclase family protein [Alkalibacter mobilis]MBF7095737.1 cyclase family protein [Alkalibacter mobilis]
MKIYDISMEIHRDMQVYKNKDEKRPVIETTRDFRSSSAMESRISMDMHTGTHLDMPLHFVEGGTSIESLDLNKVVTNCRVLDFSHLNEVITAEDLKTKEFGEEKFLILKTQNSDSEEFNYNFVYLDELGAKYLKSQGIEGVGIDGLGIERAQSDYGTHKTLLESNILIIEGLRLNGISEGVYQLVALPLKIKGAEASPARVILLDYK